MENEIDDKYLKEIKSIKDVNIKEFNAKTNPQGLSDDQISKQKFDLAAAIMNFKSNKRS
jgi:hypothetical protein